MLVLVPGIQAGLVEFARLRPHLGPHLAVPLPDVTVPDLARHAHALGESLPPGAHDFVAASFGGLVVWALPPERVRSLVTVGTLPWRTPAASRSGRAGMALRVLPEPVYRRLYARRIREALIADGADPAELAALRPPPRAVLAGRLGAIAGWALPARPPVPARWWWGADDPWVTWSAAQVRAAGHQPEVLPGAHRPHLSHPEAVAARLAELGLLSVQGSHASMNATRVDTQARTYSTSSS